MTNNLIEKLKTKFGAIFIEVAIAAIGMSVIAHGIHSHRLWEAGIAFIVLMTI